MAISKIILWIEYRPQRHAKDSWMPTVGERSGSMLEYDRIYLKRESLDSFRKTKLAVNAVAA
jgi:hypothetical protein